MYGFRALGFIGLRSEAGGLTAKNLGNLGFKGYVGLNPEALKP